MNQIPTQVDHHIQANNPHQSLITSTTTPPTMLPTRSSTPLTSLLPPPTFGLPSSTPFRYRLHRQPNIRRAI
ncbi:hypothetical protein CsSME_00001237 [Camellia sinensis var. sinensis]